MERQIVKFERSQWSAESALDQPGSIHFASYLPYVGKLMDCHTEMIGGTLYAIYEYVPASVEEMKSSAVWQESHGIPEEDPLHERIHQAEDVAQELWQQSWHSGVPADAKIFCDAHQQERPAHGSNLYDQFRLCNECVREFEIAYARKQTNIEAWVQSSRNDHMLSRSIHEIEREGYGTVQLPDGRWIEARCLYIRDDSSLDREKHWPKGYVPWMFHVYIRSEWRPGQSFNKPDMEIVITNKEKFANLLRGNLPNHSRATGRIPKRR